MGKNDSLQDNEKTPVVHPQLCVSEDHFTKNNAFTNKKYKSLKKQRMPYMKSEKVSFEDLSGYICISSVLIYLLY